MAADTVNINLQRNLSLSLKNCLLIQKIFWIFVVVRVDLQFHYTTQHNTTQHNTITVIDINEEAINILKERNSNIKAICADFYTVNLIEKFDTVICIEGIGYFKPNLFFEKVSKLMAIDGVFIFTMQNPESWRFYLRKIKHCIKPGTKYDDMNIKQLYGILDKYGFKLEEIKGMNWIPLPLTSNSRCIRLFEYIEQKLRLYKWINQSPMLLISVIKT